MGLTEQVAQRLGLTTRTRGGMALVAAKDATRLLDGCQEMGVRVLGVEGFRLDGEAIVPDMNAIADFSGQSRAYTADASIRDARQFLRATASSGMWFEFELRRETANP